MSLITITSQASFSGDRFKSLFKDSLPTSSSPSMRNFKFTGRLPAVSIQELEAEVIAAAQTWEERLSEELTAHLGAELSAALIEEWAGRFPNYYKSSTPLNLVRDDIRMLFGDHGPM